MTYTVIVSPEAERDIRKIPAKVRNRIRFLIASLATDPYPSRSKQLREPLEHLFRIPIEEWRIIYQVEEAIILVEIIRVKRKTGPETYEDFSMNFPRHDERQTVWYRQSFS